MTSHQAVHSVYVDGLKIKKYVYSRISFNLPDHIYDTVDCLMEEFWNNTEDGCCLYAEDFEEALCKLLNHGILLGPGHIRCISSLIIDAMTHHGYIEKLR